MREAACKGGLAGSGRPDEQDRAVQGKDGAIDLAAQGEVQNRLRKKLFLEGRIQNDRIPQGAQCLIGKPAYALNALGSFPVDVPRPT